MNQAFLNGTFAALPGGAQCALGGGAGCAHGAALGAALLAATAALGWHVLAKAEANGPRRVLWAGRAVGWVLIVGGLSGFLCAALTHAGRRWCCAPAAGAVLPPGHPPVAPGTR